LGEEGLLAPFRAGGVLGPRNHDGTIIPEAPDSMWGTDATSTWTALEGEVTVFIAVDHFTAECVGIHAAKVGTRFEALEPLRQGVKAHFGGYGAGVAAGLSVRLCRR
jgi:putative transposase